jgi:RHS repeat-associated protein
MRAVRLVILTTAIATLTLCAFDAAPSSATVLCTINVNPCPPASQYAAGNKIEASLVSGTNTTFLSAVGNLVCPGSTLLGETTSAGGTEKLVEAKVTSLTFSGCVFKETPCTATAIHLPYTASFNSPETFTMEQAESVGVTATCGALATCTYSIEKAATQLVGGSAAKIRVSALGVKVSGTFLCPKEGKWDEELKVSHPNPLFLVASPQQYPPEEKLGLENPASPNICKACTGDPIDPASGNLTESQTDLTVRGRGPALGITRAYNAQLAATQTTAGPFGFGWTGSYSASLEINNETGNATVRQDNGSATVFSLAGGKYTAPSWVEASLAKEGENYLYTLPNQEKLEFNKSGQLIKEADRHKNALTLTYKEGLLSTVKDAASRTLTFTYKEGKIESIKDPMGHTIKYTYESGNLATVTLPGEETAAWKFHYDGTHRLTEITDGRGHTTKNEYDTSNRVTLQTDPLERKRKFEYKETAGVKETTIVEPNGSKTLEKFNAAGEPTETTKALGTELARTTKFEYNSALALVKRTDASGHSTTFGYDSAGNKTSEKDANENETKWVYNSTHDVTSETTPKGETTTITRNAAGDPESIKRPAPGEKTQETKFKYAENGDLEEETDPLGHKTKYEYDTYGDRKAEIDPEGDKKTWGYNENGQVTSEVSSRGNEEGAKASEFETKTERDAQGRSTKITDPLGHETKFKYDANGKLEVLTNPNGHATTYVYDADNERTEVKASNGNVVKTAYDSEGKIKSKTDGNGHTTTYERNLLEQVTEVIDPLERKTTRKYDTAGNLKELKDPEGRTATYTYDAGDRLKEINYSEEATHDVTYEYGKDGEVSAVKDGTGTSKYTYDELDRLTETENGNKEIVKYEYDLGNQITKVTYPNGKSITRAFDSAGRLEKVTDWLSKETKFAYNRDSVPKTTTFPTASGNVDEYAYNRAGQLEKTTMKKGAETLASISYARDNAGQLTSATQKGLPGAEKPEYEYDEKERLKKGAGTSVEYDAADSPTKLGTSTLKYDKASQLEEGGGSKYTFDKLGERTKATPASGPATTYGYDQAGNLISVKRPKEGEVAGIEDTYAYDGTGLRASETISGTTTHMAWDTTEDLPLLLSDGINSYIYGPEGLPFEQINSKEEASYLHHDQQGSTRLITNASGETKGTYTYTPYGAVEGHTGTATTPLGYDGQYTSSDTGLIYLRARVYDPTTAQFMSVDPLAGATGETYGYATGNPTNAGDPSGKAVLGVLTIPVVTGWMTVPVLTGWATMPVVTGWAPILTPFGWTMTPLFSWMTVPTIGWMTMPVSSWVSTPVLVGLMPLLPPIEPRRPAVIVFDENGEVMLGAGARVANGEFCEEEPE